MVKKKNKTLESVLFIINELNHNFSQPIVEQTLKECDGDIDKAIDFLERIRERDEIARKKSLLESDAEGDDQLRLVSVISELTNLLGHLTVDLDYFKDVIRNEKYDVERCIERYFDAIESHGEDEHDCSLNSSQQNNMYSTNSASTSDDVYDLVSSKDDNNSTEGSQRIYNRESYSDDSNILSDAAQENSIQSSPYSESSSILLQHSPDKIHANIECFSSDVTTLENNTVELFDCIEMERRHLDLAMNFINSAGEPSESSYINHESNLNSNRYDYTRGVEEMNNQNFRIGSDLGVEQKQVYLNMFDDLIDQADLIAYWNESYISIKNKKLNKHSKQTRDISHTDSQNNQNDNNHYELNNVVEEDEKIFLFVIDRAISTALAHLDDEDEDWNLLIKEEDMASFEEKKVENNDLNLKDKKVKPKRDYCMNNEKNEHHMFDYSHSDQSNINNNRVCNDYDKSYDNKNNNNKNNNNNEKLNYELIAALAEMEQEKYYNKKSEKFQDTQDDLLRKIKNVFGNHKCEFSDRLILKCLKEHDNDIEMTIDNLISKQTKDTLSSLLDNNKDKNNYNHYNSLIKNNRYVNSDMSYATAVSFDSDIDEKKLNQYNNEFFSNKKTKNYPEMTNDFFCEKNGFRRTNNSSNNDLIALCHDENYMSNNLIDSNKLHYIDNNNYYDNNYHDEFDDEKSRILKSDYNAALNAHNYLNNTNMNENSIMNDNINSNNNEINNSSSNYNNNSNINKGKALQWRLVASKEGLKMRESLRRESSQKNLPQMSRAQGVICKQKLLLYGNMAAKYALEDRNPNLNISMSKSGRIEFMGFQQNTDFHGNQNIQTLKNIRNGDKDLELLGYSKKIIINTFDLHGLLVREALQFITSIFQYYGSEERRILRFIVGRGNHSIGGISRLGPALKKYFDNRNISHTDYDGEIRARINA